MHAGVPPCSRDLGRSHARLVATHSGVQRRGAPANQPHDHLCAGVFAACRQGQQATRHQQALAAIAAVASASSGQRRRRDRQRRGPASGAPPAGTGLDKLDRFLSKAGVLSRAEAGFAVRRGKVSLNGRRVFDPWQLVQPGRDRVEVDGFGEVALPDWKTTPPRIVVFNKPQDVVVTMRTDDPLLRGRSSIHDALPEPWRSCLAPHVPALRPVGRLDAASVGLLLLTDSSGLGAQLLQPGTCEKEYILRVRPRPDASAVARLAAGVRIRDGNAARGPTKPCDVLVADSDAESAVLRFTIQEGRNRQLRRMCDAVGLSVDWLMRLRMGPVELGSLGLGAARDATEEERAALLAVAGA